MPWLIIVQIQLAEGSCKCSNVALSLELPVEELNNLSLFPTLMCPQNSSVTTGVYNHQQLTQTLQVV